MMTRFTTMTKRSAMLALTLTAVACSDDGTQIIDKQVSDGKLVDGYGFGPNLAYLAGGTVAEGSTTDPLRSPHNSHFDVLARLGVVGISLWISLWIGWYWRMIKGCRHLAQRGLFIRRRVAILCLMVTTGILLGSFFDPSLEGAQAAVLLWIAFGVGVAVTSFRAWFREQDLQVFEPVRRSRRYPVGTLSPSSPQRLRSSSLGLAKYRSTRER